MELTRHDVEIPARVERTFTISMSEDEAHSVWVALNHIDDDTPHRLPQCLVSLMTILRSRNVP